MSRYHLSPSCQVEKEENSKKHREKMSRNRELFEKVFNELRKQREDRERFTRVGARVKSDAEMEEIMDGLQEQEVDKCY
jgi:nuclear receptor co-repressor 1